MALGDHPKARGAYEQAMALGIASARDFRDLGSISEQEGNLEPARMYYQRAIEMDPEYGDSYYRLASLVEKLGEDADASALYRRAISLDPDHASAHYNLARLYIRQGREEGQGLMQAFQDIKSYEKNLKARKRAVSRNPRDPQAAYELGMTYFERGRFTNAMEVFEKVVKLDPDFTEAREKLRQIRQVN